MGGTQRAGSEGRTQRDRPGWHRDDPESSDFLERFLEGGKATRFQRKFPLPSFGDRFGELTVVGIGPKGKHTSIYVRCSCGADPHLVEFHNLRKGKSTRCNACAKRKTVATRKMFYKYAAIVPDDEHRRRLLNRLAACRNRCHNPNDAGYPNYGGRGIRVHPNWLKNKAEFLAHVASLPGWDDPSLEMDRVDVDKGYEPGNIRFITRSENMLNKRSVRVMQARIIELEARLRHCTCGASQQVHDPH